MKILWVKSDFLHPTTKGGKIRTLEMLKQLHRRHEIHYISLDDGTQPEGLARSGEYCSHVYAIPHRVPEKTSPGFAVQLASGLFSSMPVPIGRFVSAAMKRKTTELIAREKFDSVVCDFLSAAPNVPNLPECVLFEHNVESTIWQRRVEHAANPAARWYLGIQARRMLRYEGEVCRTARRVIAVSELDADRMRKQFQTPGAVAVPTGVDVEYFTPPSPRPKNSGLVFIGSMDWMPNSDGILWFARDVLPLIRRSRPECSLTVAGRKPSEEILQLAKDHARIEVTGTVPDVRPYLWQSSVSIVPLRIGGGTRLKIYEAMAARSPVVSTTVGAEGLAIADGENIRLADTPESFARICVELLEDEAARERIAQAAWGLVRSRCSWEAVSREFERLIAP